MTDLRLKVAEALGWKKYAFAPNAPRGTERRWWLDSPKARTRPYHPDLVIEAPADYEPYADAIRNLPAWDQSLDLAIAAADELGYQWEVYNLRNRVGAKVHTQHITVATKATTPAQALAQAIVRARQARSKHHPAQNDTSRSA